MKRLDKPTWRDRHTTAQGLFLSADAYLDAARRLQDPLSGEGHAVMPIRFLLYHAAELYLKAYLRLAGVSVDGLMNLRHSFTKLAEECVNRGLFLAVDDCHVLEHDEAEDQVMRARYLVTGAQRQYGLASLQRAVEGIRFDVRHHPAIQAQLQFRPWDKPGDPALRADLPRWKPCTD